MKNYFLKYLTQTLSIQEKQTASVVRLLTEGNTVPFISRYRKEQTENLNEVQIFDIEKGLKQYNELESRKETVLNTIEEQGKLSPELKTRIENTCDMLTLEDIYLPYKPKRKTKASVARANKLEPLALWLLEQKNNDPFQKASAFINAEVPDIEAALQGARDIIAEVVSEDNRVRESLRKMYYREAVLGTKVVKGKDEEGLKYKDYFSFSEDISRCKPHRLMAVLRGESEGILKYKLGADEEKANSLIERYYLKANNDCGQQVKMAIEDSYKRLLHPSMETDTINFYKDLADKEAIKVFASNLRQLLLLPPLGPARILALDPGFRTGCKVVCLDETGDLIHNQTIYPHAPQNEKALAGKKILSLVEMYHIDAIAIGNGTASRETEHFIKALRFKKDIKVFIVDESGASVYSASPVARKEFPDYDVTVRGAVSIGRRLIDPLAELIKIDPEAIGVGQYQHDINAKNLKEELDNVVISCVNHVGVNVNTASEQLLTYVSGLSGKAAAAIIQHRTKEGKISSRNELKKVKGIGEVSFQQCAGFIRIPESDNPLDNTAVHPESYKLVEKMAKELKTDVKTLAGNKELVTKINPSKFISENTGVETINDILSELIKPGRDPRGKPTTFSFDDTIKSINDLSEGMVLNGIITNITNFGAFVDLGIKQNGLIHVSEMSDTFIKNPAEVVSIHQQVKVRIVSLDMERKRIQLSLKSLQ